MIEVFKTGAAYRQGYMANMQSVSFRDNPYVFGSPRWFAWDDGYAAAACHKLGNIMQKKSGGFINMIVTVGAAWVVCGLVILAAMTVLYQLTKL